jgi:hypothetical protein
MWPFRSQQRCVPSVSSYNGTVQKQVGKVSGQAQDIQEARKLERQEVMAKKAVEAPKGYHWMKVGKGFKLMKNPTGGYKPHKGASKKASFEVQKVHK